MYSKRSYFIMFPFTKGQVKCFSYASGAVLKKENKTLFTIYHKIIQFIKDISACDYKRFGDRHFVSYSMLCI